MRLHRKIRTAVAVACTVTLGAAPLLVHTAATARTADAAIQSITVKVAKKTINVKGANGLRSGRVQVTMKGGSAEIVMFKKGYDAKDLAKDIAALDKGDIKALKRALAHTTFLGGFEKGGSGTVVLPKAGDYSVFSFESRGIAEFSAGSVKKAPTPKTDGTIVAKTGPKWAGSSTLPAAGTFQFKNKDKTVPHFVILQHVAEGTTTDQVLEALQNDTGNGPPPPFLLPESLETASLNPGHSMTVDYDLPAGQYVVMCFFPDPNMGGMPHALMGMLRMIHLT
jgi:hypothetical protein